MRNVGAPHHALEDRAQPLVRKHLLCEDDEGVVHIVLGYSSGDAVQVSRSQCAEPSARSIGIRRAVCVLGKLDDERGSSVDRPGFGGRAGEPTRLEAFEQAVAAA